MSIAITCIEDGGFELTPAPGYRLHRALAPDAPFRYITVGERAPELPAEISAWSGRYEIFHTGDVAAAPFDPDATEAPVVFINGLVVAPGNEDVAFEAWHRVNVYMVKQPGYRRHTLHKRVHDHAAFGFVNIVEWESVQSWKAAHDDGFRALTQPPLPFDPMPTLCELVADGAALQAAADAS
jgi:heme-degrading monooxygenase HmoA